jgi:glycosyltransferase involved in cell wall biosynthesis
VSIISVVIPILNESDNIRELRQRLDQTFQGMGQDYEIIFVDDGSADQSLREIKYLSAGDHRIRYISFTRNFGHQIAIHAGIEHCRGELIIIMDGDLQDPPELIPSMVKKISEGYEVVYATRKERREESYLKRITASLFYRLMNSISSTVIPVDTGDFRVITSPVADQLKMMNDRHKFIRGEVAWTGFNQASLEYDREGRRSGKSNFSYRKMISFAVDGITGYSNAPLKFATVGGIIVSTVSFLLIAYAIILKLAYPQKTAFMSPILLAVLFLGGIQLLSIGIIGEYISRINEQTRHRPLYIIRESNAKS